MAQKSCKQKGPELSQCPCRALYLHVPFCKAKCRYCDFYSLPMDPALAAEYVRSARTELGADISVLQPPLASVFLGGGTPSVLGKALLGELLVDISPLVGPRTEFSIEANPGAIDGPLAAELVRRGVNRVNLGAQSFDDAELALLGRIHDSRQIATAVACLRDAGVKNLGLDLIYGLPGQTPGRWRDSVRRAIDAGIEHLSCYALSFEPHTPLHLDLLDGKVAEMDEGLQRECYYAAIDLASRAGLEHYEISNFARPGRRCRHNLTYWHNQPYLGIGPAAASYIDGCRRTNAADLAGYVAAISRGESPASAGECLVGWREMAETLMLELRLIEGADRQAFARRFGQDPVEAFSRSIERYRRQGALEVDEQAIRIGKDFLFVADTILADIVDESR